MITRDQFIVLVGEEPIEDDLERCNCTEKGEVGHFQCGICAKHWTPMFMCSCGMKVLKGESVEYL